MDVKSFKDSAKNVVKLGETVGLKGLNGEVFDKGTVERIEKQGYFITVFIKERPGYRLYPQKLIRL